MFKLASLFVEIKAKDDALQGQLDGVRTHLGVMGTAIGTAAGALAASAIAGASAALAGFVARGVKGAIDLQETLSKVNTIFGDGASIITRQADEMAAKFGTAKGEFLNAASDFGSAFKAIGTAAPEAAALGNQLAKLGMDMASFNNASNEEAFTALRAALRGEFDPLERFNVMLSAAAIEQEALSSGLLKSAKDMDEAAKKQATLNLILRKTVDQQGDLERTADGSANSWRKLTGTLDNLAVSIGTKLEPGINALIAVGTEMATDLAAAFESCKGAFEGFSGGIVEAASTIGVMWRNLGDVWEIATVQASTALVNFLNVLAVVPTNIAEVAAYVGRNWYQLIYDGVSASIAVFQNFAENLRRVVEAVVAYMQNPTAGFHVDFKPLLDGFAATAEKFPELTKAAAVSADEQIAAISRRIADRESKRAADLADRAKKAAAPAKAAASAAAKKEKDFKSEVMSGSEFALKLRASIYEKGGEDTAKRQLEEQKKTAQATQKMAELLGGGALVARLG